MKYFRKYPSNYIRANKNPNMIKCEDGSIFEGITDISNASSEDFASGTPICRFTSADGVRAISIVVNGDVEYDEDDEEISNNWYEIVYYDDGDEVDSDVADVDGMSFKQLCDYCSKEMKNF